MSATMQKDGYKEYHRKAGHPAVSSTYLNFTNRSSKHSNVPDSQGVLLVGLQYFIKDHLVDEWNREFFFNPKDEAVHNHKRILSAMLGKEVDVEHLEALHDLGYLPLKIKALPEGTLVPYGVASFTIASTHEDFEWLPGAIETVTSTEVWPISTSATTARAYYKNVIEMAKATGLPEFLIRMMAHDFSMRGTFGKQAGAMSGFGHLASGLIGTDTIPAILFAEKYYNANVDTEVVGVTVDATEHGVTCQWMDEGEEVFFRHLMNKITPSGVLSLVSDTWDFWNLVTVTLPLLKEDIMARDGTVVIRPDSGDPVEILCGWKSERFTTDRESLCPEGKGLIECLWDTFGGTVTKEGYKLLDSHIGAIYGDAITLDRQKEIYERLMEKGFVPSVVLGVGSYTYQYVTRDTHGSAVKATHIIKDGVDTAVFKDPKTDPGKKSAKGLLRIEEIDGVITMFDNQTREQEESGLLETVFYNGNIIKETSLEEIRATVLKGL